jgi:hypothetical protein
MRNKHPRHLEAVELLASNDGMRYLTGPRIRSDIRAVFGMGCDAAWSVYEQACIRWSTKGLARTMRGAVDFAQ